MFSTYDTLESARHISPRSAAILSCQKNLMALSWHMPISKSPFHYAIAMREENLSHNLIEIHGSFTLNFLPFEHAAAVDLSGRYHGDEINKFVSSGLKSSAKDPHGNLLLDASDFIYTCEVIDRYKNGDHTIFISKVTSIHVSQSPSHKPTFFLGRGRYATLGDAIQLEKASLPS